MRIRTNNYCKSLIVRNSLGICTCISREGLKIFSYALSSDRDWIDIESPTHAGRNNDLIDKILSQMKVKKKKGYELAD